VYLLLGFLTSAQPTALNPIRADMAKTPEQSDFTSIQERIKKIMQKKHCDLLPFVDCTKNKETAIPFELNDQ